MSDNTDNTNTPNVDAAAAADNAGPSGNVDGNAPQVNPNNVSSGGEPQVQAKASDIDISDYVSKKDYDELLKKMGENSEEVGSYRQFFKEISPVLDKLHDSPEVADAILDEKFTAEMATAILEGKVSLGDANDVTNAHDKVKKDLGDKAYAKAAPGDIEKLVADQLASVDEKIKAATDNFSKGISDIEEKRKVENETKVFIENVGDFDEYAEGVVEYLNDHPNVDDIETAYFAVKGMKLSSEAASNAIKTAAEEKKNLAANAQGGMSQGKQIIKDTNLVDELIPGSMNANDRF